MRKYAMTLTLLILAVLVLVWRNYSPVSKASETAIDLNVSKDEMKPLVSRVQDLHQEQTYYPLIAKKLLAEKGACPQEGIFCAERALAALDETDLYAQYGRGALLIAREQFAEAFVVNEQLREVLRADRARPSCLYVLTLLRKMALLHQQNRSLNEVKEDFKTLTADEAALLEKLCDSEGFGLKKLQDFVASNPSELVTIGKESGTSSLP